MTLRQTFSKLLTPYAPWSLPLQETFQLWSDEPCKYPGTDIARYVYCLLLLRNDGCDSHTAVIGVNQPPQRDRHTAYSNFAMAPLTDDQGSVSLIMPLAVKGPG